MVQASIFYSIPKVYVLAVGLLCLSSVTLVMSRDIDECMQACATCISFYGRDLYDARACILNCHATAGSSFDGMCQNEKYHLVKKASGSLMLQSCRKYCGLCVLRWTKAVYHGGKCAQFCELTGGTSVDSECADPAFSRLDKSMTYNQVIEN